MKISIPPETYLQKSFDPADARRVAEFIARGRPFDGYLDQPDTAERVRRDLLSIPFALPPKKEEAACL